MEYCESNLRKFLKSEEKITIEERKRMAIEVKKGEQYLEDVGIRHLDLKPENLLIAKNGSLRLADFGLCAVPKRNESYEKMGYAMRGSKYRDSSYLCKILKKSPLIFKLLIIFRCWNGGFCWQTAAC